MITDLENNTFANDNKVEKSSERLPNQTVTPTLLLTLTFIWWRSDTVVYNSRGTSPFSHLSYPTKG